MAVKRPAACAAALGITVEDADSETDPGIVEATRLLSIGKALVDAYLRGGADCPEAIRDEAVIRTAGHVKDRRTFGAQEGRLKTGGVQMDLSPAAAGSVRQSGAGALLAPYVRRSA